MKSGDVSLRVCPSHLGRLPPTRVAGKDEQSVCLDARVLVSYMYCHHPGKLGAWDAIWRCYNKITRACDTCVTLVAHVRGYI